MSANINVPLKQKTKYCLVLVKPSEEVSMPEFPVRGLTFEFDRPTESNLTIKVYIRYQGHGERQIMFNIPKGTSKYISDIDDYIFDENDILLHLPWEIKSDNPDVDKNIYILVKNRDLTVNYDFVKFTNVETKSNEWALMTDQVVPYPVNFKISNQEDMTVQLTGGYNEGYFSYGNQAIPKDPDNESAVINIEKLSPNDFYSYKRKKGIKDTVIKDIAINLHINNYSSQITGSYYLYNSWEHVINKLRSAGGLILDDLRISTLNLGINTNDFNFIYNNQKLILELTSGNTKKFDLNRIRPTLWAQSNTIGGGVSLSEITSGGVSSNYSDIIKFDFNIPNNLEGFTIYIELYYL